MSRPTTAERAKKPAAAALSHPLRVRILQVVTLRDMSPSRFVEEELAKGYFDGGSSIAQVSYHFRELAMAGCLDVVDHVQVRGSIEHIYRAIGRAFHSTEEWEKLSAKVRREITTVTWQTLIAQVESSRLTDVFDSRKDRHMTWSPVRLDEQGWNDVGQLLDAALERTQEIAAESADRLATADDPKPIDTTVAHLAFPSAPTQGRPAAS